MERYSTLCGLKVEPRPSNIVFNDRAVHRGLVRHPDECLTAEILEADRLARRETMIARQAKEAEAVVAEIREAGGRADSVAADLSASDGPHKLAKQVRAVVGDRLDILGSKAATIEETTVKDFDKLFAVNVRAPFFLVQQLLPIMSKGSSIVFVSSLAARAVVGTIPAYAATKGAIDTLVKHFASMLGARGIRVNAVAPGVVQTDMSNFTKTEAGRDFALGMQALKRLAQPNDIGGVIAFLASEDARWITGDTIHVDGGSKL
jgi:3-oxoacyl-[acyl-carrier protein] reductase